MRFERSQEEAALDLGASQWQMMTRVVLPQLAPALAASFIFAFAWSFNNFEISFFTGGYDQTFPVWVYSVLRNSNNLPIVNAMSTLISAVQVAVVYLLWWGIRRVSRRRGSADELAAMVTSGVARMTLASTRCSLTSPTSCPSLPDQVGAQAPGRAGFQRLTSSCRSLVLLGAVRLPDGDPGSDQRRAWESTAQSRSGP